MKFALLAMVLLGSGCVAFTSSLQSEFFAKFSLRELVQRTSSISGLNCSAQGGGGGSAAGIGGFGGRKATFHKSEGFSCQMTDDEQFDEANFIQRLKQNVAADLDESKAKILGSNNIGVTGFCFEYALGAIGGRLEISGAKSPGNYYSLKADLDEKTGQAK